LRLRIVWLTLLSLVSLGVASAQDARWPKDYPRSSMVTDPIYAVGDTIKGKIDGAETVALIDALGRECARAKGPSYQIKVPAYHTDWNYVVGYRGGREVTRKHFLIAAPRGPRELSDYLVIVWHAPATEAEARLIRQLGATCFVGKYWREGHEACLRAHMNWYHHNLESKSCLTTYHANRREFERARAEYARHRAEPRKYAVRQPCLNDPATFERLDREQLRKKIVGCHTRDFGTLLFYEIADEGSISKLNAPMDFCFGPHCMREMRKWLRQKYGDLKTLNRTWGNSFAAWDTVVPDTTFKAVARKDRNYASWCDHRQFMDLTLFRFVSKVAARVRELSGGIEAAYLGTEMPSSFGGYNWYYLGRAVRVHEAYNIGDSVECLRSFAPPGARMFRSAFGGYRPTDLYKNWRHLFHDQAGVILWAPSLGRLIARGKLTEGARRLAPHLFELRSGIGKLIIDAKRINDDVAVHYSQQSIRIDWMVDAVNGGNAKVPWHTRRENHEWFRQSSNGTRGAALRVVEDNQLQFRFVATPEIGAGALRRQGYKLLLLHHSFVISRAEAAAIREFVRAGGVVVSDAQVGSFTGTGTPAAAGALNDLFGIKGVPARHAPIRNAQSRIALSVAEASRVGLDLRGIDLRALPAFSEVKATDGIVLARDGETPVVVAKAHGKGLAVYLNVSISPYLLWRLDLKSPEKSRGFRQLIGALAARAGVRRTWAVTRHGTKDLLPCTEAFKYANGKYLYFAAMRNYQVREQGLGGDIRVRATEGMLHPNTQKPEAVSIRLPRRGHVYDVRASKYLGRVEQVNTTLDPILPALYAVLPAKVESMAAVATFDRSTGYAALTASLKAEDNSKLGSHVLHVEVTDPKGKRWLPLLKNYAAPEGKLAARVFIGTNALAGRWQLLVRDAATGVGTEVAVDVQKE